MMAELGADTTIHIVRLAYAGRDWNMASKDVNFARGSVQWRWEQGYQDGLRGIALGQGCPFSESDTGIVVHDLPSGETHVAPSRAARMAKATERSS
jgi:NTE family protein